MLSFYVFTLGTNRLFYFIFFTLINFNVFLWHGLILMLTGSSPFLDPEMLKFIEDFQQLVLKDALQGGTDRRTKVIDFQLPQDLEVGSFSSQTSHAWSW